MTPTPDPKAKTPGGADQARKALAAATANEAKARKALAEARKATKAAARKLLATLAGDLNLSADERRALGLPKGAR